MGEQNTLFVSDGSGLVSALDAATGAVKWSTPARELLTSTAGGGIITQDWDNTLRILTPDGEVTTEVAENGMAVPGPVSAWSIVTDSQVAGGATLNFEYSSSGYHSPKGSILGNLGPKFCQPAIDSNYVGRPPLSLTFQFYEQTDYPGDGGPITSAQRNLIRAGATLWTENGYPLSHLHEQAGPTTGNVIRIKWFPLHEFDALTFGYAPFPTSFTQERFSFQIRSSRFAHIPPDQFGMLLDSIFPSRTDPENNALLQFIAGHEFGHLIGLKHVADDCAFDASVMPVHPKLRNNRTTLSATDLDALAALLAGRRW
jgi:hypothetical protein